MGVFGCFEVTIGFFGKERVDYMTYDTKGIFRCYEIKVTKADFKSNAAKSFVGHYNYYVLTRELYNQVKNEIPDWIGVYIGQECVKRPKKQDIDSKTYSYRRGINGRSTEVILPYTDMLKESMIRSLYRDSDKLLQTGDEQYINRLKNKLAKTEQEKLKMEQKYNRMFVNMVEKYGYDEAEKIARGESI